MTTYPIWAPGDPISSAFLRAGQEQMLVKTANQDVTDSTTMVDDVELSVLLEAGSTYMMIWCLAVGAVDNGGGSEPHINTDYTVLFSDGVDAAVGTATRPPVSGFKFAQGPAYPGTATSDRENTNMVSATHNFGTDRRYGTISTTSAAAVIEHHQITTRDEPVTLTLRYALGNNPAGAGDVCRVLAGSFVSWWQVAGPSR